MSPDARYTTEITAAASDIDGLGHVSSLACFRIPEVLRRAFAAPAGGES